MNTYIEHPNGTAVPFDTVPCLPLEDLAAFIRDALAAERRILAFFACSEGSAYRLIAVMGNSAQGTIRIASASVGQRYPALTPILPALNWFEREIAEQFGIVPEGHPWLKPIRSHGPEMGGSDAWGRAPEEIQPGGGRFFEITGAAGHEVAVGPVHAGVIEPGHFRFQCLGETVEHLEITLGYQHRGIEKLMEGGPDVRSLHYAETAAGDTTIASAWCYAGIIEALTETTPSSDVLRERTILLSLERLANHIGDLGALAGDVAYLPTASYCGRIRGEYLNMTAEIAGNRFGRSVVVPGGSRAGISPSQAAKLLAWIQRVYPELLNALELMFDAPSVLDRLEGTGTVDAATAREIGMTGTAGKASGLTIAPWRPTNPPPQASGYVGDVLSRAKVRFDEIRSTHDYLFAELAAIAQSQPTTNTSPTIGALRPNQIVVHVTDAWRGELVHVALTSAEGTFRRYKIVDPSFHNWFGLALALRGEQISNFPICNKSFNLSYCGHDL